MSKQAVIVGASPGGLAAAMILLLMGQDTSGTKLHRRQRDCLPGRTR